MPHRSPRPARLWASSSWCSVWTTDTGAVSGCQRTARAMIRLRIGRTQGCSVTAQAPATRGARADGCRGNRMVVVGRADCAPPARSSTSHRGRATWRPPLQSRRQRTAASRRALALEASSRLLRRKGRCSSRDSASTRALPARRRPVAHRRVVVRARQAQRLPGLVSVHDVAVAAKDARAPSAARVLRHQRQPPQPRARARPARRC
jgi:hypothetical protein